MWPRRWPCRRWPTSVGGTFARLQFTPDLVPSDIVGTRICEPGSEPFDTELGPVFANLVLADEINRAPAKVQSALLEVMAERQVSHRRPDVPAAGAVPGAGHPEPDRVRGRLPAARGAAGPLPAQGRRRHPTDAEELAILHRMSVRAAARRPGAHPRAACWRCRSAATTCSSTTRWPSTRCGWSLATREPRRVRPRPTSTARSSSAPARGRRSASSPRRGRWRCCAAATTCCPVTSPTSRAT